MRVALLHNARPAGEHPVFPDDTFEEYDSPDTIDHIAYALRNLGVNVEPVLADRALASRLERGNYDMAFNIAEGPVNLAGRARRNREALAAATCELLALPYTGSDVLTLAVTMDKSMACQVVSAAVPVARGLLLEDDSVHHALASLVYPVVVKPNDEGSSKGIHDDCVACDYNGAVKQFRVLREQYHCPVRVEEYLPGVEVTVAVTGNWPHDHVLGMMEIEPANDAEYFVYSLDVKRDYRNRVRYHTPPRLPAATLEELRRSALAAYRMLGCRDLARMDFRLDAAGRPRFIECNPLPGLNRENSDMVILTRSVLSYEALVQSVLINAATRCGMRIPK